MAENYINGKSRGGLRGVRGQQFIRHTTNPIQSRIARGGGPGRDLSNNWRGREENGNVHMPRGAPRGRGRGRGMINGRIQKREPTQSFNGPFEDPQTLPESWAVFCFDDYNELTVKPRELRDFVDRMLADAKKFGMNFNMPQEVAIQLLNDLDDVDIFFDDLERNTKFENLKLIFIGIPDHFKNIGTDRVYDKIKHYSDSELGIISQCFKAEFIKHTPDQYFNNFLQKVNAKLGGINKIFDPSFLDPIPLNRDRTMIVGIVNHPAELSKLHQTQCSISVGIGSYDNVFSKYSTSVTVQSTNADDSIDAIDNIIDNLMRDYRLQNRNYPEILFIFRDGLTRAQIDGPFIKNEIKAIKELLNRKAPETKLTAIVVQKRRPLNNIRPNRKVNIPNKTVNDREVTDGQSDVFDLGEYYKSETKANLTKFIIVLQDDRNYLCNEHIKKFTYYACQNYSRASTQIDIPTCIRYADLCAGRSKIHAHYKLDEILNKDKKERTESIIRQLDASVKMNRKVKRTLYYC